MGQPLGSFRCLACYFEVVRALRLAVLKGFCLARMPRFLKRAYDCGGGLSSESGVAVRVCFLTVSLFELEFWGLDCGFVFCTSSTCGWPEGSACLNGTMMRFLCFLPLLRGCSILRAHVLHALFTLQRLKHRLSGVWGMPDPECPFNPGILNPDPHNLNPSSPCLHVPRALKPSFASHMGPKP